MLNRSIIYDEVINAAINRKIEWRHVNFSIKKLPLLSSKIRYISESTGLPYPPVLINPEVKILLHEFGVHGIVHGCIFYLKIYDRVIPVVDISLPFLLNADSKLITGVLAHEFLHYLFLAYKFIKADYFSLSQYFGGTVLGRLIFDEAHQISPKKIFKKKYVVKLLEKELAKLLGRKSFINRIIRGWIKRGFPHKELLSEEFFIRMSINEFRKLYFPSEVLDVVKEI